MGAIKGNSTLLRDRSFSDERGFLQIAAEWPNEVQGGLNRFVGGLAHAFAEVQLRQHWICVGTSPAGPGGDCHVHAVAPIKAPLRIRRAAVRRAVRDLRPSCRLATSHFALYGAAALRALGDLPLVVHFHGPWADESALEGAGRLNVWAKRRLEKRVYRHAARLITLSQAFADVLVERYAVDPLRIRVVPPAVDGQAFAVNASRSDARDALEWPKDRPIVFCVRRLARRMGLENLIDAWREVRRTVPDALLVIGGKGPLAAELADRISASTLHEHVVLAGFIPDAQLPLAYRAADLTVVPTQELEGFGLVTLESQAAGTPALVTPVGGLPDGVRDLAPQLVLPDKTTAAIAAGLQGALLGRVTLPDQEACQRHVRSRFSWPLVRERVLGVYAEAL